MLPSNFKPCRPLQGFSFALIIVLMEKYENDTAEDVAERMGVDTSPHLDLDSKQLPAVKDWKLGKEYKIVATVKMTSASVREDDCVSGCFKVKNIKAL